MISLKRFLSHILTLIFFAIFIIQSSCPILADQGNFLNLPEPGTMVSLSPKFVPAYVKGISIYPNDPFKFDFIIDTGDTKFNDRQFKDEANKLIKYFMAALTVPEKEDWVNLSPYEKDRIVPESLGVTEMGRDMLAQDYILKQLTSSLIYPEQEIGKEFWSKVYEQAQKQFGTTEIPVNTFNKVWIVPSQAVVWEHNNSAYVVRSHLKVMLEQDYLSLNKHLNNKDVQTTNAVGSNVVRQVVLPALEKDVNEGANFAAVRQIFNSAILAAWYKQNLRQSILGQVYADKDKVTGVDLSDRKIKQKIYERYVQAFKTGAFNFIKEDENPATHQTVPRKYFSGGMMDLAQVTEIKKGNFAQLSADEQNGFGGRLKSRVTVEFTQAGASRAMITAEELKEANERAKNYIEGANLEIALELTRSGLRGGYKKVADILGKETGKDDKGKKYWTLNIEQLAALQVYYGDLEKKFPQSEYIMKAVDLIMHKNAGGNLTEKEQNSILRGAIKKTADAIAAETRQKLRDKYDVISVLRFVEGISDGVMQAGRAGKIDLPSYLEQREQERQKIENAIQVAIEQKLDMQVYRVGNAIFPIIEEGNDDLEGTDAYVDNPDYPPAWFSGSTSISAYGLGVGSLRGLGFIPDEAYAGEFLANMGNIENANEFRNITVQEKNRHGEIQPFHLYDPELYALNPDRFIEVLKFKARKEFGNDSPGHLAQLRVAVTVMDRPTERAFINALKRMQEGGIPGLKVVLIKAGSVAHGKKAVMTRGQFENEYKKDYGPEDVIMLSRVGPVEAALNMVDAKKNEDNGAVGAMRIFSGNMQNNPEGGDMQNQDRRYEFTKGRPDPEDNEEEMITKLREETGDALAILHGEKIFTTADLPAHLNTSATVIVGSPFLGQPGVTKNADGKLVVRLISNGSVKEHVSDSAQTAAKPVNVDRAALAKFNNPDIQGGINLDADLYNMQVLRDGKGMPLPVSQQPIGQFMKIKGFKPVFLNIERNINLPERLGVNFDKLPKEHLAQSSTGSGQEAVF